MAAPVDSARIGTNVSTAATSFNINVGSPVAGTLLIVFVRFAGNPGTVTFTGYGTLAQADLDAADDTTGIYYKLADGTEGASDVLGTTNSVKLAAISWEVTGAQDPGVDAPIVSTAATGTTAANSANPGSVAPFSPPQDTLYIAMAGGDGEVGAYTASPTNYSTVTAANSGTGGVAASNVFIGAGSRQITASSSDDPGVFTHAAHTTGWTAYTIAIRPPPAVTPSVPILVTAPYRPA